MREGRDRHRPPKRRATRRHLVGWGVAGLLVVMAVPAAADRIFLQDGRTIQADKVDVVGDRVRIEGSGGTVELPRSEVLSIHPVTPPSGTPGLPSPADTYRDLPTQMNDRLRREIQDSRGKPAPR